MTQFAPEMAILLIVSLFGFLLVLNGVYGRLSRISEFIHSMRFELMENKPISDRGPFFIYLAILTYWQIILPFLVVTFWGVLLIYDAVVDTEKADDAQEITCEKDDQLCEARKFV